MTYCDSLLFQREAVVGHAKKKLKSFNSLALLSDEFSRRKSEDDQIK